MNINESLLSDMPLENPKEDRLGIAPFARNLANAICKMKNEDCLVYAIYGSWGSGKTTCLNFIIHYIKERPKEEAPILLRFNPWWFSGHGELLNQFFKEFRLAIGQKEKELGDLVSYFGDILSEIPEPTGVAKLGGVIVTKSVLKLSRKKTVWAVRQKIQKKLKDQKFRMLVVIDDIDRLPKEEINSLFKVIKAVADFPKTTYLLAFDRKVVTKALRTFQGILGEEYLEKIVQVPFELPSQDRTGIHKLFIDNLNEIFFDTDENLINQTYWANTFWDGIEHFLDTLRDAKRLINALRVSYASIKGEVNPTDFVAIEALRIFQPELYSIIKNNMAMFAGSTESELFGDPRKIKPFHDKWLEQASSDDRDILKKLITRLFPKLEGVFGNNEFGSDWESIWRKQLRICSPDIFPIYFRLSLPEGFISHQEIRAILEMAGDIESFSNQLLRLSAQHQYDGSSRLSAFLERFLDYAEKEVPIENVPNILKTFFDIGDDLLLKEDEGRGLFGIGNEVRVGRIILQLLRRYESREERIRLLREAFLKGKAVYLIVDKVELLGQQQGKYGSKRRNEVEWIVDEGQLNKLELIALEKIKESAQNKDLLNRHRLIQILCRWRDWENIDVVRQWASEAISSDEALAHFLLAFLSRSASRGMRERVPKYSWQLNLKFLELFIDPAGIIDRCRNLLQKSPDWLKDEKKIALETFIRFYDLRATGKDPESFFNEEE